MNSAKDGLLTLLRSKDPNQKLGASFWDGKNWTFGDLIIEVENDTELGKQYVEAYAQCIEDRKNKP